MKLFILNPTGQITRFQYRVPGHPKQTRYVLIGPGQQEVVFDGDQEDIKDIVDQHAVYGLIPDHDVRAKRKGYTGLIFSYDRPVDITAGKIAERQNLLALAERGDELRAASALSMVDNVTQAARDRGMSTAQLGEAVASIVGEDEKGEVTAINEEKRVGSKR